MRQQTINYLITKKDNLLDNINTLLFDDIITTDTYKPLTQGEIDELNNLRKDIYEIYNIIDILNKKGEE